MSIDDRHRDKNREISRIILRTKDGSSFLPNRNRSLKQVFVARSQAAELCCLAAIMAAGT